MSGIRSGIQTQPGSGREISCPTLFAPGALLLLLCLIAPGLGMAAQTVAGNPVPVEAGKPAPASANEQSAAKSEFAEDMSRNLVGHGGPVHAIEFNKEKTRVLTGSLDYAMMLWDVRGAAPKELMRFDTHDGWVKAVTFLPSEKRALSAAGGKLWLWDLTTGKSIHIFEGHTAEVSAVALSPDGRWAASSSTDRTVRLWNLQSLEPGPVLTGHKGPVTDVAFSLDAKTIYSASYDGTIQTWEAATGEFKRVLYRHGFGINAMRRLPGKDMLVFGAINGKAHVIDGNTGDNLHEFGSFKGPLLEIAIQEKPGLLALSGSEKSGRDIVGIIRVYRIGDWAPIEEYEDPRGPIWAMDFGQFGATIYYGGKDDYVTVWQVTPRKPFETVSGPTPRRFEATKARDPGALYFARTCSLCHTLSASGGNRAGPTLFKLFGRKAGTLSGYPYSDALKNADIVWNEKTLGLLFELGPDHYTPGTKMPLQKIADQKTLKALIAYLKVATDGSDTNVRKGGTKQRTLN